MKRNIIILIFVIVVALTMFGLKTFRDAGEFKKLQPHSKYTCVKVSGVLGSEDIAIDHTTGTAFISSSDIRSLVNRTFKQGAIFSYSLTGKPVLKNLTADLKIKFTPHGISFYIAPDGRKYLFAVNHPLPGNCVEIFEYRNNSLVHLETVKNELIISPNDITAVGPRQFYLTNDHGSRSETARKLEDYLQLSRSNIVYYDGKTMSIAADGLSYANGIWASADGKHVYAATSTGRKFYEYERLADGNLKLLSQLDLETGADNIDVDATGRILVAAHPKLLTFMKHAGNHANLSPSQILEVFKKSDGGFSFKGIYLNTGDEISASSVAAAYKNHILLGAVFEKFFLDCTHKK